jgi:hypothetical protein
MYNFVILFTIFSILNFYYFTISLCPMDIVLADKLFICFNSLTNKLYFLIWNTKYPFAPHTGIDSDCQKQRFLCLAFQMEYSLSHNNGIIHNSNHNAQYMIWALWIFVCGVTALLRPFAHLYNPLWQIEQASIPTSTCQNKAWSLNDSAGS